MCVFGYLQVSDLYWKYKSWKVPLWFVCIPIFSSLYYSSMMVFQRFFSVIFFLDKNVFMCLLCTKNRAQIGECLKTIIHADYPEQWPGLLLWIKSNLQQQDQQIFGALYVLRILSRKYEYAQSYLSSVLIFKPKF